AATAVAGKWVGVVEGPGVRFVLLDSQDGVNVTPGHLGGAQRAWLARTLDADAETPALVFVHHHLNARNPSALRDTEALLELLRPRRQAKAVIFGHTHIWSCRRFGDLHAINLPAVGYRFLEQQPLGWCLFRPEPGGAELQLRCIGGDRRQHGRRVRLRWRTA
ncbi:MAG: metallophosphoesterase, partial [Isosphaeraceae bacterium]|nr:metallophosphoesterase [Isosphaeraceae bacterium]